MFALIMLLAIVSSVVIYRTIRQDWILFRDAEWQYSKKNFKEAIDLYERSLKAGLPRYYISVNLANSYVAQGQFKKAIPVYQEYLIKHPNDTNARFDLAKALSWVGNSKEAEAEYQKILEEKK